MRRFASFLLVAAVVAGCDAGDADGLAEEGRRQAEELRERTREARTRVERLRDRLRRRVRETLDRLERAVPAAPADARPPRRGDASLEAFLTEVFELQADCMAGARGASVYRAGKLKPGDVEEALGTAQAVGDFEYLDPQHHGTPDERRDAWLRGFRDGDPSVCREFVPR